MLRSRIPQNPDKPQGGKHAPPPDPDDRYIPRGLVHLMLKDVHGKNVHVILNRAQAIALADRLFKELCDAPPEGGAR